MKKFIVIHLFSVTVLLSALHANKLFYLVA